MAKAPAYQNKALLALARLLREQTEALQVDNAHDWSAPAPPVWPSRWWTV